MTYLDDCPDWDHMTTMKRVTIPLLRNGSLMKGSRCGSNFIVVRETCAFDSLTQIVTTAIATNETFADIVIRQNNKFTNFARSISFIDCHKIPSNIYEERVNILRSVSIFDTTLYKNEVMHLNANCNIAQLAEHLFADFPSMTINKKCHNCNYEHVRKIPVLTTNINILLQNGLSDMEKAILNTNHEKDTTCKNCNQLIIEKYNFKSHLLVDCSAITDRRYAAVIGIQESISVYRYTLDSIPKILYLNEQQYILAGAVAYHQYAIDKNNGHYTAYVYDTTFWNLYDDMTHKRKAVPDTEKLAPHLIMYTVTNKH